MPEVLSSKASGLCTHGNFPSSCPVCADERKTEAPRAEAPEMSVDRLKNLNSLNVKVDTDLAPMLDAVNQRLGLQMQHRESGFHVTVLGPAEKKLLDNLDEAALAELLAINDDIRGGRGVEVRGIGFIDGASANVPEKDRQKKAAFLAVDAPALNAFRQKLGLPPKDLHITLGFEGGDIHFELTGEKDAKGKDVTRPIAKKADPRYDELLASLPEIRFGGLAGEEKEKKQEKPVDAGKEAKQRLKKAVAEAGFGGKDLITLGFKPGPEMGKVAAAIEAAIGGGELAVDAPEETKAELKRRIASAKDKLA